MEYKNKNIKKDKVYAYYLIDINEKGIVNSWNECQNIVKGKKARYKSFTTETEARDWLKEGANYQESSEKKKDKKDLLLERLDKSAIYFDAGTGRGKGVEIRLTDFNGNSLLHKIIDKSKINEFGNYYLSQGRTNNFGELTGMYAALKYAIKYGIFKICGDSSLVLDYWSKGICNKEDLEDDTVKLIEKVTLLRKKFEEKNGKVEKISGDVNPADLGFHK